MKCPNGNPLCNAPCCRSPLRRAATTKRQTIKPGRSRRKVTADAEWAGSRRVAAYRARRGCECCGTSRLVDAHHRKRRREGDNSPSNLLWLCRSCHDYTHANPGEAVAVGYIVQSWDSPAAVPVRRRGTWVLLADDGSCSPCPTPHEESA